MTMIVLSVSQAKYLYLFALECSIHQKKKKILIIVELWAAAIGG